jgi:hypothetical protein
MLPEMVGLPDVASFFLALYRQQLGAPSHAQATMSATPLTDKNRRQVYKLRVRVRKQWVSRNMSIGTIGEDSHSKSQCFYVIFDTHMVVKIPPWPVKDFSDYIERIRHEKALVEKLAPWVCIIPGVSVILHHVYASVGIDDSPGKNPEDLSIQLLKAYPKYQSLLKIGGTFAFFMNLSRHLFLSYVLTQLHDVTQELKRTVASDVSLLHDGFNFEMKYGPGHAPIASKLLELYLRFDADLTAVLAETDDRFKLNDSQKRELFFARLTGQALPALAATALSESGKAALTRLFEAADPLATHTIQAYQHLIRDYARDIVFNQNRGKLETLVTNLLDLLVWIGKKGVAIRDLKPDNLLVVGNPEQYPMFLLSSHDYSIGLIDLETAIDYGASTDETVPQPYLGGTPVYATPAQFVANGVIGDVYGDVKRILLLQDWFAVVGIVYEVVTGHRLFLKTGLQIRAFIRSYKKAHADGRAIKPIFLKFNGAFWKSARSEFARKTEIHANRLAKVMLTLPSGLRQQVIDQLSREPTSGEHLDTFSEWMHRVKDGPVTWSAGELLKGMFELISALMATRMPPSHVSVAQQEPAAEDVQEPGAGLGYTLTTEIGERGRRS